MYLLKNFFKFSKQLSIADACHINEYHQLEALDAYVSLLSNNMINRRSDTVCHHCMNYDGY